MSLSEKTKSVLSFIGRFAFSFILLAWLFGKIDWEKTLEVLKTSDLGYIALAAGVFFAINIVLLFRWHLFIRALDLDSPLRDIIRFFFIGLFGNLFLPSAIGGDLIKVLGLCRNSSQKPKVVASVLIDRLSGFAGIALVAIVAFAFGHQVINDNTLLIPVLVLAVLSVGLGTALFNEKIYSFCCRIFTKLPKLKNSLMTMHYDLALLKGRQSALIKGVAWSCVSQVSLAIVFYLVAKALHQDVGLVPFFIFVPLICVAATVPSIGGLGAREAGAAYLFAKIGVESGVAVSISLISFLFMVMVGLIGGIIYVSTLSSGRVQRYKSNSDVSPKEA